MISFKPDFLKVPSACNNNFEMLKILRDEFKGQVQLSIGMTKKDEVEEIVKFFELNDQAKSRLLLYSCTSCFDIVPTGPMIGGVGHNLLIWLLFSEL